MAKQLANKYGEGSNIGSQHEGRKVPDETLFSNTRPHNRTHDFKGEIKIQLWNTMPNLIEEHREEPEVKNESIASWEYHYEKY